jgi:membrane protease YdiL (CAAX protease family)
LLILAVCSGARPANVGLTSRRLGRNLLAGLVAAVVLVPGVYGIQALTVLLIKSLGGAVQEHPFTEMGQQALYPVEWVLLVLAATVAAPVWEELFFRGIVQPWVIARPWGGPAALFVALALALASRASELESALKAPGLALLVELTPALVLLALAPGYAVLARRSRPLAGVFAAALLFAWVHARVWPSPIPLVWLALGLGWLALRTRSLVGPIVLHALFNAVACVVLLWPILRRAVE